MLDLFMVSAKTDGKTVCRIVVEPQAKRCGVTISVDGRIIRLGDENEVTVKSFTSSDWQSVDVWNRKAHDLAKAFSPFWNGETVS